MLVQNIGNCRQDIILAGVLESVRKKKTLVTGLKISRLNYTIYEFNLKETVSEDLQQIASPGPIKGFSEQS